MKNDNFEPNFNFTKEEILSCLSKESEIYSQIDLEFLVDELSKKLTRRQAIILRLMLIDDATQIEIAKLLGYSPPTICLEIKKVRNTIKNILLESIIQKSSSTF